MKGKTMNDKSDISEVSRENQQTKKDELLPNDNELLREQIRELEERQYESWLWNY